MGTPVIDVIPSPATVGETVRFFYGQRAGVADSGSPRLDRYHWSWSDGYNDQYSDLANTAGTFRLPGTYLIWFTGWLGSEAWSNWYTLTVKPAIAPTPTPTPSPSPSPTPTPTPSPSPSPTPTPTPSPGPVNQANANGLMIAGAIGLGLASLGVHSIRKYSKKKARK